MTENGITPKRLLETGTEIAGAAVGGAFGFFANNPIAAISGASIGAVISKGLFYIISDIANRQLSNREQIRVGAAAAFALSAINDMLNQGRQPRQDDFFDNENGKRSSAEELFEGILLKSKNEHQEKKIRYLGNFYANLVFSQKISSSEANFFLNMIENLTYRQICIIGIYQEKSQNSDLILKKEDYYDEYSDITDQIICLYQEILDLYTHGLIVRLTGERDGFIQVIGNWNEIAPDFMELTPLGIQLASLIDFDFEENEDVYTLLSFLMK
jgi:hypothetical protein